MRGENPGASPDPQVRKQLASGKAQSGHSGASDIFQQLVGSPCASASSLSSADRLSLILS